MKCCISCNKKHIKNDYKNVLCSDCYLDRLIAETDLYGIPIYILGHGSKFQVVFDDSNNLLGRVKFKLAKRIMAQHAPQVSNFVSSSCGQLIECEQSILVQANGENHAF